MSAAAEIQDPRARDLPDDPGTAQGRIRVIVELMTDGAWVRGETVHELAAHWGIPVSSVRNYSSAASCTLDILGDRKLVLERIMRRLSMLVFDDSQSASDVVAASRLILQANGTVKDGPQVQVNVGAMSDTEYAKHLRAELRDPDDALLGALAEPGVIEGLNALVHQRRKMLVETTGEERHED